MQPQKPILLRSAGIVAVLSESQLKLWLSTLNDEERRSMILLWGKYNQPNAPLTTYSVQRFSNGIRNEQRELMQRFVSNRITLQEWYDESRRLMKLSYLAVIEKQDQQHDNVRTLEVILILFLLLNKFAIGLMGGDIPINGRLAPRAGMYGDAVWAVSENWTLSGMLNKDKQCRRVLGPNENHCYSGDKPGSRMGCIELAQQGWIPVRQMIPIGQATCLSNCRCHLEYRDKNPLTLL